MRTGHICPGALWPHRVGVREDSWRGGCWEQDVVAQGVNWWQLVCSEQWGWGLAGPLTLLWTPRRSGPAGCWLSICKRRSVLGNGPGLQGQQGSSQLAAEQPVTACSLQHFSSRVWRVIYLESQCVGRNGGLHGGHSLSKGARGESLQVSLVKVALAPSVSHKALSQDPPSPQG